MPERRNRPVTLRPTPGEDPRIVIDWLARACSGGVLRDDRTGTRFVPWAEVLLDVQRVGAHLAAAGVGVGVRIGIRAHNSYQWLVLDLSLISLGALPVAVPVPDFAGRDNTSVMSRFGLSAIFVGPEAASPGDGAAVGSLPMLLDLPALRLRTDVPAPEGKRLPAGNEPYFTVAFSSGTGGRIKCLLIRWRGVAALIEATTIDYAFTAADRIMIALPLSTFQQRYLAYLAIRNECDIVLTTVRRFLPALIATSPTVLLGPPNFYEFVENRYRRLNTPRRLALDLAAAPARLLPTARLRRRWRRGVFGSFHAMSGGAVRLMLVGSAPVRPQMLSFFTRAGFELYQLYGMTEIGFLTWNRRAANRSGSVGRETYRGTVRIDDDGEVVVTHPWHLAIGYEGEDAESAGAVFRGDDVIATGDLGRFDPDGYLHLIGRKKNLVITTGGQKIQLEDLEAELAQAAGVLNAAVFEDLATTKSAATGQTTTKLAAVVWHESDPQAVRSAVRARIEQINARLGEGRIQRLAILAGRLEPDSPLLNRNLKLNRRAVQEATAEALQPING